MIFQGKELQDSSEKPINKGMKRNQVGHDQINFSNGNPSIFDVVKKDIQESTSTPQKIRLR